MREDCGGYQWTTRRLDRRGNPGAAIATVGGGLAHPILRRAAASARKDRLRREAPVLLKRDDGSLVEGTVDLAFHEDTSDFVGWTIVDFKTDRELEATSNRYIAQVRVYREAGARRRVRRREESSCVLMTDV